MRTPRKRQYLVEGTTPGKPASKLGRPRSGHKLCFFSPVASPNKTLASGFGATPILASSPKKGVRTRKELFQSPREKEAASFETKKESKRKPWTYNEKAALVEYISLFQDMQPTASLWPSMRKDHPYWEEAAEYVATTANSEKRLDMELTFLGTASAYPTPTRGVSCIIYRNEGTLWMFDCGEGSQTQLMKSSLKPGKISKIFITHLHGDHMFGLPGLLCTISQNFSPESKETVRIYGPTGLRRFIRESLSLSRARLGFDYVVHELEPAEEQYPANWQEWSVDHSTDDRTHPNEKMGSSIRADQNMTWHVCEDERHVVRAGSLRHSVPSFGYVIDEKPLPGKLDIAKVKARGLQPGPLCAKLKSGESVTTPSGETIHPNEVLGEERPGRKVVIFGDTCDNSAIAHLCHQADILVHEATLCNEMEASALEKAHSTPAMAAIFCKSVKVRQLILTHFSQRYKPLSADIKEGEDSVQTLLDQGRSEFGENVVAAEDLMTVPVPMRR